MSSITGQMYTDDSARQVALDPGYWVVAKRLEKGRFSWPQDIEGGRRQLVLKPTALAMLTDGIDLRDGFQRPWFELR